jgi:hypothetical protein
MKNPVFWSANWIRVFPKNFFGHNSSCPKKCPIPKDRSLSFYRHESLKTNGLSFILEVSSFSREAGRRNFSEFTSVPACHLYKQFLKTDHVQLLNMWTWIKYIHIIFISITNSQYINKICGGARIAKSVWGLCYGLENWEIFLRFPVGAGDLSPTWSV